MASLKNRFAVGQKVLWQAPLSVETVEIESIEHNGKIVQEIEVKNPTKNTILFLSNNRWAYIWEIKPA